MDAAEPTQRLHAWLTECGYDLPPLNTIIEIQVTANPNVGHWLDVRVSVVPSVR